eukprot:CAMPEP_0114506666 /NCGR_PEP_ID=MMETSP0109-20121206/11549_1 /TAXON_ID=29199 /ORGANISM="Chlorarachnion reptans, Strain CCCM449" /LENGTH=47 /DNA_ID= /DNA_START= /DNA_END= /DNA_ORIENTATION=
MPRMLLFRTAPEKRSCPFGEERAAKDRRDPGLRGQHWEELAGPGRRL